jgi:hypothetical protein
VLLVVALITTRLALADATYTPTTPDLSAIALLTSSRLALHNMARANTTADRDSAFYAAIESLVGLYQLHGCTWALPKLREVYAQPDAPDLFIGYSADGRVRLRAEEMELKNPAFASYTFYLVTLESHTSKTITVDETAPLVVHKRDGTTLTAEKIDEGHKLWPNLSGLKGTFEAPRKLPPVFGISFKQVYAVKLKAAQIDKLTLQWGEYGLEVPVQLWLGR